jgi:hypothetical protein
MYAIHVVVLSLSAQDVNEFNRMKLTFLSIYQDKTKT